MSSTQLIILWTLLGFLLSWMLLFALLAVCPEIKKKAAWKDSAIHTLHTPAQIISSAPTKLQAIATQPGNYISTAVGTVTHEQPLILEQSQ